MDAMAGSVWTAQPVIARHEDQPRRTDAPTGWQRRLPRNVQCTCARGRNRSRHIDDADPRIVDRQINSTTHPSLREIRVSSIVGMRVDPDKLPPAQIEDAPRNIRPRLLHQSINFFRNQFDQIDPACVRYEAAGPVKVRIGTPGIDGLTAGHARCPADHPQRETLEQQRQETLTQFRGGYPRPPWTAWLKQRTAVVLSAAWRHRRWRCPQWRHIREL
jgi:hypothetical protein